MDKRPGHLSLLLLSSRTALVAAALLSFSGGWASAQSPSPNPETFEWPEGKKAAVSLSFDDARPSQVDVGLPLLDRHGVKATFFVVPGAVEQRLDGWRMGRDAGHEIGNHSLHHPCSGNFPWARNKALESYTPEQMRGELEEANRRIRDLLDVTPKVFAYPCGQTFVGRGVATHSYVPIVAELFVAGRGWLDEAPNDPEFFDPAQVMGTEMDGVEFDEILPAIEEAKERGYWLVLAGHEIGESGYQTTRVSMLEDLIRYAKEPSSEIWLAPVGVVADYVLERREATRPGSAGRTGGAGQMPAVDD